MFPYFHIETLQLGPITIHVWGLMVALGILAGTWTSIWLAKKRGQNPKIFWDTAVWVLIGAFLFARLFHVFLYEPSFYLAHPIEILKIWQGGLSITGGLIGATLFGLVYLKKSGVDLIAYADTALFGLPLGIAIGRIGCVFTHLHPGSKTDFFLGIQYPDGLRHDLGLYESLSGFLLFAIFLLLQRKNGHGVSGNYIVLFSLWYSVTRFFMDFLRASDISMSDVRYFGLTPAQYTMIVLFAFGLWFVFKYKNGFRKG